MFYLFVFINCFNHNYYFNNFYVFSYLVVSGFYTVLFRFYFILNKLYLFI